MFQGDMHVEDDCKHGRILFWNTEKYGSNEEILEEALENNLLSPNILYRLLWTGYSVMLNDDGTVSYFGTHFGKLTTGRVLTTYTLVDGSLVATHHVK